MELQKKQFAFLPKMMKMSMRPMVYTAIPLILFFRWFMDYFTAFESFRFFIRSTCKKKINYKHVLPSLLHAQGICNKKN